MTRTETDKLTTTPIEIALGGRAITVRPLKGRKGIEWLQRFWAIVPDDAISKLRSISKSKGGEIKLAEVDYDALFAWLKDNARPHLTDLFDLLVDYCQPDDEERKEIEANAELDELISGFVQVAPLAFPLSKLTRALNRVATTTKFAPKTEDLEPQTNGTTDSP